MQAFNEDLGRMENCPKKVLIMFVFKAHSTCVLGVCLKSIPTWMDLATKLKDLNKNESLSVCVEISMYVITFVYVTFE